MQFWPWLLTLAVTSCCLFDLVVSRSYNNGLVFYNLRTHVPYLPPTVSVSRGRALANVKFSEKGSIWSTFGKPCDCSGGRCGCCAGLSVKQFKFDQKMCANVTWAPQREEAELEVFINEKRSSKYAVSVRDPMPFCIPVMMGVPMAMCVQMSNIAVQDNNLNMCMDFVVRLASTDMFEMHFQCMQMGLDGVEYVDKNGQPVVPPGMGGRKNTTTTATGSQGKDVEEDNEDTDEYYDGSMEESANEIGGEEEEDAEEGQEDEETEIADNYDEVTPDVSTVIDQHEKVQAFATENHENANDEHRPQLQASPSLSPSQSQSQSQSPSPLAEINIDRHDNKMTTMANHVNYTITTNTIPISDVVEATTVAVARLSESSTSSVAITTSAEQIAQETATAATITNPNTDTDSNNRKNIDDFDAVTDDADADANNAMEVAMEMDKENENENENETETETETDDYDVNGGGFGDGEENASSPMPPPPSTVASLGSLESGDDGDLYGNDSYGDGDEGNQVTMTNASGTGISSESTSNADAAVSATVIAQTATVKEYESETLAAMDGISSITPAPVPVVAVAVAANEDLTDSTESSGLTTKTTSLAPDELTSRALHRRKKNSLDSRRHWSG